MKQEINLTIWDILLNSYISSLPIVGYAVLILISITILNIVYHLSKAYIQDDDELCFDDIYKIFRLKINTYKLSHSKKKEDDHAFYMIGLILVPITFYGFIILVWPLSIFYFTWKYIIKFIRYCVRTKKQLDKHGHKDGKVIHDDSTNW